MNKIIFVVGLMFWALSAAAAVNPAADLKALRTAGADNPVKIYVFSSFSCPHCGLFHRNVLPALKEKFAEAGRAQIVLVDMPGDGKAMAGSMIARCMAPEQYEPFVSAMYAGQTQWMNAPNARDVITGYAKMAGLAEAEIDACLGNKDLQKTILAQRENLSKLYNVQAMPSVVLVKDGNRKTWTGTNAQIIMQGLNQEIKSP
ncbi:MAG: thioredoxin domain-containing protein [Alphaproteobacteria bacterium]|nr:thioredoxin domain-containing protein [Alphaproteobacteria bacterium]